MNQYWILLQERYQQLATKVDQSVLRERALLLAILAVIIYIIWSLVFIFPQQHRLTITKSTEQALTEQVALLKQKIITIEKTINHQADPVARSRGSLLSESALITIFKSILAKHHGINLTGLYSLPNKSLDLPTNYIKTTLAVPLYEQIITLTFNGNYLHFYEYLKLLEDLKLMLFWDELQYTVTEYPNADIKLTVYLVNQIKPEATLPG